MTALKPASLDARWFVSVMLATTHIIRLPVPLPALDSPKWQSPVRAFAWGVRSVASTVLTLVLFATYLGIGALAHDTHFSLGMGAGEHGSGLGGSGADHPDLDAGLRRNGGAGGDCRDRQRDPAVSDGGIGIADDAHAADQAASSGAGRRISSRSPCGSNAFACCRRCRANGGSRSCMGSAFGLVRVCLVSNRDRLRSCGQSARNCLAPRSCC